LIPTPTEFNPPIRSTKINSINNPLTPFTQHPISSTMSRAVSRLSTPILRASSSRLAAPSKFLTTSAKKNASDLARLTGRNALLSTPVARVARGPAVLGARSASSDEGGSMMVGRVRYLTAWRRSYGEDDNLDLESALLE